MYQVLGSTGQGERQGHVLWDRAQRKEERKSLFPRAEGTSLARSAAHRKVASMTGALNWCGLLALCFGFNLSPFSDLRWAVPAGALP